MIKQLAKNEFGQVNETQLATDMQGLTIEHEHCKAQISLYGAQVLTWQPSQQHPVFWLSPCALYKTGKAIRGGVPLCWPWFGTHSNDENKTAGNHGFARQSFWQVNAVDITEAGVNISLHWQGENIHSLWPYACRLEQQLFFGKEFHQTLKMTNLSEQTIEYTGALHNYFCVSHPQNIQIDGLSVASFYDQLTDEHCEAEIFVNGVGPVDRIYDFTEVANKTLQINDKQWQRIIEIEPINTQQWVFWNPGTALANQMSDIDDGGEYNFVCLEAANTDLNAKVQIISANSSVCIGQKIRIKSTTI